MKRVPSSTPRSTPRGMRNASTTIERARGKM